jgi:hypothetical protein
MTTTWTIAQLDRQTSDGLVTTAHWRVDAVDGELLCWLLRHSGL